MGEIHPAGAASRLDAALRAVHPQIAASVQQGLVRVSGPAHAAAACSELVYTALGLPVEPDLFALAAQEIEMLHPAVTASVVEFSLSAADADWIASLLPEPPAAQNTGPAL
jgi:hypothetical protein